jgi:hypothetical protein
MDTDVASRDRDTFMDTTMEKKQDNIVNFIFKHIYIFGRNIKPMSRRSLFNKSKCRVRNVLV